MKEYPLEVQELHEFQSGHLGWWSKGHHDAAQFLVEAWYVYNIIKLSDDVIAHASIPFVRYEWWRCVPAPGKRFTLTVAAKPGTRGAFPVTVWYD